MAAVLPVWARSEFGEGTGTRLSWTALRELETPLRLVWSRPQAAIRPFLDGLGRTLATALAAWLESV